MAGSMLITDYKDKVGMDMLIIQTDLLPSVDVGQHTEFVYGKIVSIMQSSLKGIEAYIRCCL